MINYQLDLKFYKNEYEDLSDLDESMLKIHWDSHGKYEGRFASYEHKEMVENSGLKFDIFELYRLIKESGFIDEEFYRTKYSVKNSIDHYLRVGVYSDLQPNLFFEPKFYLKSFDKKLDMPASYHFLKHGFKEMRFISKREEDIFNIIFEENEFDFAKFSNKFGPFIDENSMILFFLRNNDLIKELNYCYNSIKAASEFFLNDSVDENNEPVSSKTDEKLNEEIHIVRTSGLFDVSYYLGSYRDVHKTGQDPVEHFCKFGWQEGRNPNSNFNVNYYKEKYPDIPLSGMNPFVHWLQYGRREGRLINVIDVNVDLSFKRNCPSLIFVSHEASQTGAPSVLLSLMKWVKTNTNINFSIIVGHKGPWNNRFQEIAPTFFMDDPHGDDFQKNLRAFCGDQVQAVYINTIASALYAQQLDYLSPKFITHVHEMENVFKLFPDHVEVLKRISKDFISVSPGSTEALNKRFSNINLHFLKPFIETYDNTRLALAPSNSKFKVFGCGAVEQRKGFDLFCDIAAHIKKMGIDDFQFYWIGNDKGTDLEVSETINSRDVSDIVEYLGPQECPRDFFKWGGVFLLPSREDPYPLVCMEAAEMGLPVICFDEQAGGMSTFVEHDVGAVIPYLDTLKMAESTVALAKDKTKYNACSKRAIEKVKERHYVDVIAPQITALFPDSIDSMGNDEVENYKKLIENSKIVSFDIFDTLVVRKVSDPAVAFKVMEKRYSDSESLPLDLFDVRMRAAGQALSLHRGTFDDIDLNEIYMNMPIFREQSIESSVEIDLCIQHPLGKELYDYAISLGKHVYITSDMYLDKATVQNILRKNGYEQWDQFFLSSEYHKKKDTGKLFDTLIQFAKRDGAEPYEILHIGDNWIGDVKCSRQKGLNSIRFSPLYEEATKLVPSKNVANSNNEKLWSSYVDQAAKYFYRNKPGLSSEFFTKLGYELTGPMAMMMAAHTLQLALKRGVRKIVFMARDGSIIKKAFDKVFAEDIKAHGLESLYLHLSRATVVPATFSHPLKDNDIYFLSEGLHFGDKDITYYLKKANLDLSNLKVQRVVNKYFSQLDYKPSDRDSLKISRMFRELSSLIYEANFEKRQALLSYLSEFEILKDDNVILVDVGWMLNIHSRLQNFARLNNSGTNFIGSYVGSHSRSDHSLDYECLLFKQSQPSFFANVIEQNITLFELLFSAPEASASKLIISNQKVETIFKEMSATPGKEFEVAKNLHFGATNFFDHFVSNNLNELKYNISQDYIFNIFKDLLDQKSELFKVYLNNFDVALGGQHEINMSHNFIHCSEPYEYRIAESREYFEPIKYKSKDKSISSVLIVTSSSLANGSTRYRALNLAKSLSLNGYDATVIHCSEQSIIYRDLIANHKNIVFQRVFDEQGNIADMYKVARDFGVKCIGEIDDLIFPDTIEEVGSVKGGEWDIDEAMFVAKGYESFLSKMDFCITSSDVISSYIESKLKIKAITVKNKIDKDLIKEKTLDKPDHDSIKLVYSSGTYSHKEDFKIIEYSLYDILKNNNKFELTLLGNVQVSSEFLALKNVNLIPLLDYQSMLNELSKNDVLLVPLVNSDFNNAKSNVKFIEASLAKVATIASNVKEYNIVMKDALSKNLINSDSNWSDIIKSCLTDKGRVVNDAKTAHKNVIDTLSLEKIEKDLLELLEV